MDRFDLSGRASAGARFGSLTDTPASFVLTGVRMIDPAAGSDVAGNLALVDGVIRADAGADVRRISGEGLVVTPGFCDLHAHLRTPGGEGAETIESGARAAAHGGFTTVCVMPNTDPALDEPLRVAGLLAQADHSSARIRVIAAATRGREGADLTDHRTLVDAGAVAVSDDGAAIPSAAVTRRILAYLAPLGVALVEHAEDAGLADGSVMRGGPTATRLGLGAWPASAEATIVERDLALAAETGGWVHFTHLSTAAALDPIRRAKAAGTRVTCDVTPHHLALTDTWVGGDRRYAWDVSGDDAWTELDPRLAYDGTTRVNPPLPSASDARALLDALVDGTIDAIATDHAPHPQERKAVPFAESAPGMIGLETALGIGLAAVAAGRLELSILLAALSARPAALIGESRSLTVGETADLVVFDPEASWTVARESLASGSWNTPLLGRELPGLVHLTVASGRITYDAGLIGPA